MKVICCWNSVDNNVDLYFHCEYEDGVVEVKGVYNQV